MESSLVIKLFGLLEATAGQAEGRSLADLAAEVGLTKPTAHRILKTLSSLGYIERTRPGYYRQTNRLRRVISGQDDQRLIHCSQPALRELHQVTRETINLGVLRQGRIVYLSVLESPEPLRRIVNPNMTDPFACTALGRAIVAHLPEERRGYLLRNTVLEKRTPFTIVDPVELLALLENVHRSGFAMEENETDIGVLCLGAPVFDRDGVAGAISITLPTVRDTEDRRKSFVGLLLGTAEEVTAALRSEA
ncbi:IclR family transcriptional regulator [Tundrisphaera lichenicola]|uniref:IclR family transcriptional regulator n=1 Tax=Tundrisphaera lichenicola TaxID=2029860 RepID=UPI003EB97E87